MASSKPSCDPCSRKELPLVVAVNFCNDCAEHLCMDCVNVHSLFKALSSHHIIDLGSLPMETLSVKNSCTKHEDMALDFFCVDHDCLCCRSCMAETHRACQKFVPVDVASKGVRRSLMLEDVSSTVSSLRGTLEKLIGNRDENLKSLNDEESDVLRNVSLIKSEILERLDDLERKVVSELKSLKAECENKIKSDKDTLLKMVDSLDQVTSKLNIVSKHGSENQLFILLNSYKWKVSDCDIKIQEIIASTITSKISFNQPQQQPSIESLGSVHIESTPCPIKYKTSKSKQAQVLPTTIQMPTKFDFDMKFDVKSTGDVCITSIAVTDDNRLLLCNNLSTKLLVYSDRGEYLQDCTLSGNPWGIAIIPGEDKAVVSLPVKCSIQFVDIKSMKSGGKHSVPDYCYGIAVVGDKICVGGYSEIYILSKQGKHTTSITVPGGCIYYLHPCPQDSLYYTAFMMNRVGCVKLSGEVRFTCTPENFKGPEAVTTDRGGNLYLACYSSNNIHRLSFDGNVIDIILDDDKKISKPYGLAFSRNYRNLFVTNDDGMSVFVFSCS